MRPTDTFATHVMDIAAMAQRLTTAADDHFDVSSDAVTWSDVAQIERVAAALREVCDVAFAEGEYAMDERN